MDPKKIAELRNYYDRTDTSAELEHAVRDDETDQSPMVGITVRLPADLLNAVRDLAAPAM